MSGVHPLMFLALLVGYSAAALGVLLEQIHGAAGVLADVAVCLFLVYGVVALFEGVWARVS